jgi:hypothetical protein
LENDLTIAGVIKGLDIALELVKKSRTILEATKKLELAGSVLTLTNKKGT